MNGAHVELFSYCFYKTRLPVLQSQGALGSLTVGEYEPAIGRDVEPYFVLTYQHGEGQCPLEVDVVDTVCRIACLKSELEQAPELKEALESLGTLAELTEYMAVEIPRNQMEDSIKELATRLAE
ncbi:MAG: hypothetical protein WD009_11610 [Phycisphaeraceae bacterium]